MNESGTTLETDVIEPDLPIIDCHHHLWIQPKGRYLLDEYATDLASGHKVVDTIYVECHSMYRKSGPEPLRPIGEAEFVAGIGAMSDSGHFGSTRVCAGFVGAADLSLGSEVDDMLDSLKNASAGRLRGIRGTANWDADATMNTGVRPFGPKDMLLDPGFRSGFARLKQHKLVYDAWQYHPQLPQLCDLADAFLDTQIVVNHCGGLLGIGPYASADNYTNWKQFVTDVAKRPNTLMKLGGLSAPRCGFGYSSRPIPPTAEDLAREWRPYIETCIELFGPERCMFESNFPPDKIAGSYRTVWNAFKLIAAHYSPSEKDALFSDTARRTYRID